MHHITTTNAQLRAIDQIAQDYQIAEVVTHIVQPEGARHIEVTLQGRYYNIMSDGYTVQLESPSNHHIDNDWNILDQLARLGE